MTGCTTTADAPAYEAGHCPLDRGVKPLVDGRAIARMLDFEKRRCYVCGTRADDGCCGGVDGERAECPWY